MNGGMTVLNRRSPVLNEEFGVRAVSRLFLIRTDIRKLSERRKAKVLQGFIWGK